MRELFSGEPRTPIVDCRLNLFTVLLALPEKKAVYCEHSVKLKQTAYLLAIKLIHFFWNFSSRFIFESLFSLKETPYYPTNVL